MLGLEDDLNYLCTQLKRGVVIGAGVTLFCSGIVIGMKAASVIIDTASRLSSDGYDSLKRTVDTIIQEEDKYEKSIK